MATMRRRKQAKDDQLTESLLDDYDARDADDVAPEPHEPPHKAVPSAAAPSRHTALIVHPGEFNLQAFIQSVLAWWQRMFGACFGPIFSYATHLWPVPSREPQLSLLQAERLQQLRDKVAERFDIASPSHQDSLRRLWSLAFSGEPCTALKTPRWKDMGWQGDDPATDFRGAGLYGLDNLIYLAEVHPDTFRRLLDKSEGTRAAWEYPFAVAGLNLTWALSELLELHAPTGAAAAAAAAAANSNSDSSGPRPPRGAAGRAFLTLLSESEVAFEELYCAAYCLLDATWLEMRASYMEFNAVMKRVKGQVEKALASRPADMAQLRQRLLAGVPGAAVWD
ncbi:hypothetical protein CHLRE_12g557252v5 [Chlamydomonas reinhardtii]|uniref:ELMO domain-containing protein n=1 Tax=Chlamydomonas reinhardtii TaxID=3055 RepID=A0A2K3D5R4_CHLRE|nr:uncharacterized protein CHLRE_12g557252v5 [Chlamydomonas reinhardtii]PNW75866.1 hypothetical protein CHLRE_12g557252v5 [Chlamydomonas reinhardtii]